jgi:NADPH:quinone reductase-like Zn-dependent oxidoreductase
MKAVMFDKFGAIDVLTIVDVPQPVAGSGQVLVKVKATGINPGEASIREGRMAAIFPTTFPSGEGSDFAGTIEAVGDGVTSFTISDDVIGFSNNRAAHAEYVVVPADQLISKSKKVSWEEGGSLFVAGTTAYASIQAVDLQPGDTVVVSGAAGGVGSIAVQLAKNKGAKVIGLASTANHQWLTDHGITAITYGDQMEEDINKAANGKVDAFIDTFGKGYVDLAIKLGVAPERINTIIDFEAAKKNHVKTDGSAKAANTGVLAELAKLIEEGKLDIPIARAYPLGEVREAYKEIELRHTHGKIVLIP